MKRKFTLLMSAAICAFTMNSQVMLNESFTAPFTPSTAGWYQQNNSVPIGTGTWFQGNGTVIPAYSGGPNDYFACNFQSQGNTSGGISNFLITPTVNLTNGGVLQFATRTETNPAQYPDRLQVLYSYGTATGAIGAGTTAVGTFTGQITTINPSLTTTGYPGTWTVYSMTLAGITGTLPGRIAFRYWVDNGGQNGSNSDYIGIDDVMYTFPCAPPTIVLSQTVGNICSGQTFTTNATGATSYTWAPGGQTTSSISITPSTTTIYTVTGVLAGCPATNTVAVNVTASPTVAVNNATICSGVTATLQASGATNYSWQPGGQVTSSIAVSPTVNTTYTVIGNNGSCSQTKTVSVTISSSLGINVVASQNTICSGKSATLTASGAQSYSWSTGATTSSIVVSPGASTAYVVGGLIPPSCVGSNTINITVNPSPTVTGALSPTQVCIGSNPSFTLTGSGAVNYTWSIGVQSFSNNPLSITTPTTAGVYNFTLVGQAINGCYGVPMTVPVTVTNCNVGIEVNSASAANVAVYPNPFTTELNLSGFSGNVEVYNALGQVVISTSVKESEAVNTASLPKGVYIVKAYSTEGTVVKTVRVIKN